MGLTIFQNDYIPLLIPEELTKPSPDATNAGLLLISLACKLYREKFRSNTVPFSFIDFYISEMSHYKKELSKPTKEFFEYYEKTKSLEMNIRMYTMSGYNVAKDTKTIDGYQYLILNPKRHFYIENYIDYPTSEVEQNTAIELKATHDKYINRDELKNLNELYDDYLIKNFIDNYNNVEHHDRKQTKSEIEEKVEKLDTTLIGEKTEVPTQKGKVVQLNIPRFKLPMGYPIDLNNSRILSEKRVKKFIYADQCINVINKHKISAIGFTVGFVEKRKSVKKKNNFDKFGFDF